MTDTNSSFSQQTPGLQIGLDSTSLGAFKVCPRYYQLSIIEGFSRPSVHLEFGLWLHKGIEVYHHARAEDHGHDEALDTALWKILALTWNTTLGRPWLSDHKIKTRRSLVQTLVWYLDNFAEDAVETLQLANGKPAVEMSFRFDSGLRTRKGEVILFCGHLDRLGSFAGETWIIDPKTTTSALDPRWFDGWTPGNQFSMYSLAGKLAFESPVAGVIVDGCQIGVGFSRFQRGFIKRTDAMLEEWYEDTKFWYGQMETCAEAQYWPMNDRSCDQYGGCQFRGICSKPPAARRAWLEAEFQKRVWDPLQARGEV